MSERARWCAWSEAEIALLREAWPRGGRAAALRALPARSLDSVLGMALRLGLKSSRSWSQEEIALLRQHYAAGGPEAACGALPHRSYDAVTGKAGALGLCYERLWWTEEERARVTEAYLRGGLPAARLIAPERSDRALQIIAELPSSRIWTVAERRALRNAWVGGGVEAACAALPERTRVAIVGQARRMKLKSPTAKRAWDKVDLEMLQRLYPNLGPQETARRMSWRSPRAVESKAQDLNLTRRRSRSPCNAGAGLQ